MHLLSTVEKAALELLEHVRFGLDRLPEFLRLPDSRRTAHEFELDAGAHDRRLAFTYATSERMAIGSTSTHSHIDEWADMPRPPGGSWHQFPRGATQRRECSQSPTRVRKSL